MGLKIFAFNLDDFCEKYYYSLYKEIGSNEHDSKFVGKNDHQNKVAKIERNRQYYALIKDYLISEGFTNTLSSFLEKSDIIEDYCGM